MNVKLYGGENKIPSWFNVYGRNEDSGEDAEGIYRSSRMVHSLIANEERLGIPARRIVIGGMSQGGALALFSALTYDKPLGGVIALSTWLPLHRHFLSTAASIKWTHGETPIFQAHGDSDEDVATRFADMSARILTSISSKHEYKVYEGRGHSLCDEAKFDMQNFLDRVLPC